MTDLFDRIKTALADRYAIERVLGSGGMATVYLARDLRHDRRVAVKVLRPELAATLGGERFLREIKIIAQLQHPHIVSLHDSGEVSGFLFYVMPYIEGESLRHRLRREGQLSLTGAVEIAREVAAALAYAHERGVIHRDIKPENILLSAGEAVVTDFGVARAVSVASEESLTGTGLAVGTPTYMSPEQASGEHRLDARTDIYGLGCVLYEMLAGEPPHTGPSAQAITARKLSEPVRPLQAVRDTVPDGIARVTMKALARSPADRFQTAKQMVEALKPPRISAIRAWSGGERLSPRAAAVIAVVVLAIVAGLSWLVRPWSLGTVGRVGDRPRLVVLPFDNLGSPEDEYFAAGITDEITARLAGVTGVDVIARQSAVLYKDSPKTPGQIRDELDVDYILEATISWQRAADAPSRVRVRPQLIRAQDASHVWAGVYDEELDEVFRVQTNIAEHVVNALGIALLEPEQQTLGKQPTDDLEAYVFYLQGNDYFNRGHSAENFRIAEEMYQQALARDPQFAEAHARLSRTYASLYWFAEPTQEHLDRARAAVERAFELAPALPEAHLALGYYHYWGSRDYGRALEQFAMGRQLAPQNSELMVAQAMVQRRQGLFEEAIRNLVTAATLNPRSNREALELGMTYSLYRDYENAEQHFDRAIALTPDWESPYVWKALLYLRWHGDPALAERVLQEAAQRVDRSAVLAEFPNVFGVRALVRILSADDGEVLGTIQRESFGPEEALYYLFQGELQRRRGEAQLAAAYYDSVRALLQPQGGARVDDPLFHSLMGLAYAGLGRADEAIRHGQRAVELLPISKDAFYGTAYPAYLAQIYAMVGDHDAAIDEIQFLLRVPGRLSVPLLRIDPAWDSLREHPRFQRLLLRQD